MAEQITARSRIIPLGDCDDVFDGDQHYITFQTGSPDWIQHSPQKRHHRSYTGKQLPVLYRESRHEWKRVDRSFAIGLFHKAATFVTEVVRREEPAQREMIRLLEFEPEQAEQREVLLATADLLAVTLGVTLVLVGSA